MFLQKQRKSSSQICKGNRLLISITFLGSPGPIRFLVNEDDAVSAVIEIALKNYAREGRFPVLGSHSDNFILYCSIAGTEALNPSTTIGSVGMRNFVLFKKPQEKTFGSGEKKQGIMGVAGLKGWLNKSLNLKISSH